MSSLLREERGGRSTRGARETPWDNVNSELTVKGAPKTPRESSLNSELTVKGEGSPRGAYIYIYIYIYIRMCYVYVCDVYVCDVYLCDVYVYTCVMYTYVCVYVYLSTY